MKKIFLFVGVISMITLSCNKEVPTTGTSINTSNTPSASKIVSSPGDNFSITFDAKGSYTTTDANYINSFPQLKSAVTTVASSIESKSVTINVDEYGMVTSNKVEFDGLDLMDLMTTYGNFYFAAAENLTVVYGKEGFKSISNPEMFEMFPTMKERLIENGEIMKYQITDGKDVSFSISKDNQLLINGVVTSTTTEDIDEYNRCTRYYYWFGSTASAIMCAYTLFQ
jgi:hypothetical protein|tara:strand:+ start:1294 stop:1971 length:678 start_codon:yes stop_codon:yes gene_type:complete